MASWTIIGTGKEGDLQGKAFGLTLVTENNTWIVAGPSVGEFFVTRNGTWRVLVAPEQGTRLNGASGDEVAFFRGLTGTSAVGNTGTGRANEKGANFDWKLDSK